MSPEEQIVPGTIYRVKEGWWLINQTGAIADDIQLQVGDLIVVIGISIYIAAASYPLDPNYYWVSFWGQKGLIDRTALIRKCELVT